MAGGEKRVVAKSIHSEVKKLSNRELWAKVCYYYPQYTLKEASRLPLRDIKLLLRVAEREKAQDKYDFTQIASAPHTEKGKGVKQLSDYFKQKMD